MECPPTESHAEIWTLCSLTHITEFFDEFILWLLSQSLGILPIREITIGYFFRLYFSLTDWSRDVLNIQIGYGYFLKPTRGFLHLIEPVGGHIFQFLTEVFWNVYLVQNVLNVTFIICIITLVGELRIHQSMNTLRDV